MFHIRWHPPLRGKIRSLNKVCRARGKSPYTSTFVARFPLLKSSDSGQHKASHYHRCYRTRTSPEEPRLQPLPACSSRVLFVEKSFYSFWILLLAVLPPGYDL